MWSYEKRLQFPVNIKEPNAKLAQVIISQYGGPDGEMGASMRYLSQRYSMPYSEQKSGFANYYVDHTIGVWPQAAGGVPFNACEFQVKGDIITDLHESMAAEQKARSTYDNILRLIKDPDVCDPIKFLRAREIVHYQRFGEALRIAQDHLNSRNFYAFNPGFDRCDSCET